MLEAYERMMDQPTPTMVHTSIVAFFEFAERRPAGFSLLFDAAPGAPVVDAGERALTALTERVADAIRSYVAQRGRSWDPVAEVVAAMAIGAASYTAGYVLRTGVVAMEEAGELASSFAYAGYTRLDPELAGT